MMITTVIKGSLSSLSQVIPRRVPFVLKLKTFDIKTHNIIYTIVSSNIACPLPSTERERDLLEAG